ncbi:MAG: hypothetical protein K8U57_29710 [Planctomycetes bacterium]|nr:hypothetical protein [Planctomycetota bacterium]
MYGILLTVVLSWQVIAPFAIKPGMSRESTEVMLGEFGSDWVAFGNSDNPTTIVRYHRANCFVYYDASRKVQFVRITASSDTQSEPSVQRQ